MQAQTAVISATASSSISSADLSFDGTNSPLLYLEDSIFQAPNCYPCGFQMFTMCCDNPYPTPQKKLFYLMFPMSGLVNANCMLSASLQLTFANGTNPLGNPAVANMVYVRSISSGWPAAGSFTWPAVRSALPVYDVASPQLFTQSGANYSLSIPATFITDALASARPLLALEIELLNAGAANVEVDFASFNAANPSQVPSLTVVFNSTGTCPLPASSCSSSTVGSTFFPFTASGSTQTPICAQGTYPTKTISCSNGVITPDTSSTFCAATACASFFTPSTNWDVSAGFKCQTGYTAVGGTPARTCSDGYFGAITMPCLRKNLIFIFIFILLFYFILFPGPGANLAPPCPD